MFSEYFQVGRGFQFAAAARLAGCPSEEKPRRRWTLATLVFGFCSFWSWAVFDFCNFWSRVTFDFCSFGLLSWMVFDFCNIGPSNLNFMNQLDFRAEGESSPSKTLQPIQRVGLMNICMNMYERTYHFNKYIRVIVPDWPSPLIEKKSTCLRTSM